jgi:hypothetical protein
MAGRQVEHGPEIRPESCISRGAKQYPAGFLRRIHPTEQVILLLIGEMGTNFRLKIDQVGHVSLDESRFRRVLTVDRYYSSDKILARSA